MADKEVRIRVKADIEPNVVQPRVTVQTGGGDERFNIPRFSGQMGGNIKTPTPPPRNFEEERYNRIRSSAEENLRGFISESSRYTTSSREMERFINERVKRISSSSELDYSRQVIGIEERRKSGSLSNREATEQLRIAKEQYNEDKLQTKILKDTLETIKSTSREEIRENAKAVQDRLATSRNVGRLGIEGDEYKAFSEKFQSDEMQQEKILRKFNLGRYANAAVSGGSAFMGGDIAGIASAGGRGLLGSIGGVGVGGGIAIGGTALGLLAIAAMFSANKEVPDRLRSFMLSTQSGVGGIKENYNRFQSADFSQMGMTPFEGMDFYGNLLRSSGGRSMSLRQARGYAGLTRATDISSELLSQLVATQRYSNGGDAMSVAVTFERTLKDIFGGEFKKKLVQIPEMVNVYNSLAQNLIQRTGGLNSSTLASFVSGIREGFGVEGVNLQRYAGNLATGFLGSQNPFIRKMQFSAIRGAYGSNIDYQRALEIMERPMDNPEYMRMMYSEMKKTGLAPFRSWMQSMGFGAAESGRFFNTKDFEEMFSVMKSGSNKTSPPADFDKYFKEAQNFYSLAEKQTASFKEGLDDFKTWLSDNWEGMSSKGVKNGVTQAIRENGGALPVKNQTYNVGNRSH